MVQGNLTFPYYIIHPHLTFCKNTNNNKWCVSEEMVVPWGVAGKYTNEEAQSSQRLLVVMDSILKEKDDCDFVSSAAIGRP